MAGDSNPMKATLAIGAAVAFAMGIGVAAFVWRPTQINSASSTPSPHPVWIAAPWPFPIDQWGKGNAFQCKASDCGTVVDLYVRPKLGSCNCMTGIASDEDLDRMGDLALIGANASPLGDGRPITVGWMKGRTRMYVLAANGNKSAMSVVFNDRCDMIAATIVLPTPSPSAIAQPVMDFLNSQPMLHWAELELGI